MFRQATVSGLRPLDHRAVRASRRTLERELADYASDADRNDLQLLADARITSAAWELGEILGRQAEIRLFRGR